MWWLLLLAPRLKVINCDAIHQILCRMGAVLSKVLAKERRSCKRSSSTCKRGNTFSAIIIIIMLLWSYMAHKEYSYFFDFHLSEICCLKRYKTLNHLKEQVLMTNGRQFWHDVWKLSFSPFFSSTRQNGLGRDICRVCPKATWKYLGMI